jgi:hypothetical protein
MEKYDAYGIKGITKLFNLAKEFAENNMNNHEVVYTLMEMGYNDPDAMNIVDSAMKYGDKLTVEEKIWYRIGEPITNAYGNAYKASYNYAEDRPENGISVVTADWMHSLKSVFFGAHDNDTIKTKGIYKIKGVQIGFGGDDEPLIYATDWAEKTDITTVDELEKVVM